MLLDLYIAFMGEAPAPWRGPLSATFDSFEWRNGEMKNEIKQGATSQVIRIKAIDSATGAPLTGLSYASAGLALSYIRAGDTAATSVPLVAGEVGAWAAGGFVEVSSELMPGIYEIGIPNAVFAVLGDVTFSLFGAANLLQDDWECNVVYNDPLAALIVGGYAAGEDPPALLSPSFAAAIGAILARLGAIQVVMSAPVTETGEIDIVQGADYFAADGQAITWSNTGGWPDLTGATVTWDFKRHRSQEVVASFACEVLSGTTVQLELSAAQTATIPYSWSEIRDRYELWATLVSGHKIRIAQGPVFVGV